MPLVRSLVAWMLEMMLLALLLVAGVFLGAHLTQSDFSGQSIHLNLSDLRDAEALFIMIFLALFWTLYAEVALIARLICNRRCLQFYPGITAFLMLAAATVLRHVFTTPLRPVDEVDLIFVPMMAMLAASAAYLSTWLVRSNEAIAPMA